jgi:hypothetical protein
MSQQLPKTICVNCGELCSTTVCTAYEINLLHEDIGPLSANISVGFDKFVEDAEELPVRVVDLLQIAAYVFCADRMANRGERSSINNSAWSRSFEFHIPVLDYDFWQNDEVKTALNNALTFMTGDRRYGFSFVKSHRNPTEKDNKQYSIFAGDHRNFDGDIMLFSGGLDSLAGTIQRLNEYSDHSLCVVSHRSNKTVSHTQAALIRSLNSKYGQRLKSYGFECCNHNGLKSKEETQRTRIFLFSAIAFALCSYYHKHEFYIYENGITSINLSKQIDVINARASRTTHPKTLGLLRCFYKLFDSDFNIFAPYYNLTKAEIMGVFKRYHEENLISSSVSCSSSRTKPGQVAHCGCCSQCIDRRFSVFAAGLEEYDAEYATDFIARFPSDDRHETKQRIYSTLRFAYREDFETRDAFVEKYPSEVLDIMEFWPGARNADDKLDEIYSLVCRYGDSVINAATVMRNKYDDLRHPVDSNSLLGIVASRSYMNSPFYNRAEEIDSVLKKAIPDLFQREKPKSENDLNDKIHAILCVQDKFMREFPTLCFGLSAYRADHSNGDLIIESKYIRDKTTPSKATEGIAADIVKIPDDYGVLFVVYDPYGSIVDSDEFVASFEQKRKNCYVRIYR